MRDTRKNSFFYVSDKDTLRLLSDIQVEITITIKIIIYHQINAECKQQALTISFKGCLILKKRFHFYKRNPRAPFNSNQYKQTNILPLWYSSGSPKYFYFQSSVLLAENKKKMHFCDVINFFFFCWTQKVSSSHLFLFLIFIFLRHFFLYYLTLNRKKGEHEQKYKLF